MSDLPDMDWNSHTVDGQVQLESEVLTGLLLILGANLRYSILASEQLILPDDDELRGATFLHLNWQPTFKEEKLPIQITAGVRADFNDLTGLTVSPRTAVVYRSSQVQSFKLSYGSAFRKPSFLESRLHVRIEEFNSATPEIVDLLAEQFSNKNLANEKVSTFEVGWHRSFLDEKLAMSADLFFSLYQDLITMRITIEERLGLPNLANSFLEMRNNAPEVTAAGGEFEVVFKPSDEWSLWGNLGLRKIWFRKEDTSLDETEEPALKINLGGRYKSRTGWLADLALHYVSSYAMRLSRIDNIVLPATSEKLGNQLFAIGRLGRRVTGPAGVELEAGIEVRTPVGAPFREFAGKQMPMHLSRDTLSDWAGEMLYRQLTVYLRGNI
jgi:outer membrane receptor for ferrienterochelin and colicin